MHGTQNNQIKDDIGLDEFLINYKKQISNKFNRHIEQLIKFFDSLSINYENLEREENPIFLLSKLMHTENCIERNNIIEKIDIIVNNI